MPLLVNIAYFEWTKLIQLQYDGINHSLNCHSNFQFLHVIHVLEFGAENHRVIPCRPLGLQQKRSQKCLQGLAEIIHALSCHRGPFEMCPYFEPLRHIILLSSDTGAVVSLKILILVTVPKFIY